MTDLDLRRLEREARLAPDDELVRERLRAARERLDPEVWALDRWVATRVRATGGLSPAAVRVATAAAISHGRWWFSLPYHERGGGANLFMVVAVLIDGERLGIGVRSLRSTHGLGIRPVVIASQAWPTLRDLRWPSNLDPEPHHDSVARASVARIATRAFLWSRAPSVRVTMVAVARRWLDLPREAP